MQAQKTEVARDLKQLKRSIALTYFFTTDDLYLKQVDIASLRKNKKLPTQQIEAAQEYIAKNDLFKELSETDQTSLYTLCQQVLNFSQVNFINGETENTRSQSKLPPAALIHALTANPKLVESITKGEYLDALFPKAVIDDATGFLTEPDLAFYVLLSRNPDFIRSFFTAVQANQNLKDRVDFNRRFTANGYNLLHIAAMLADPDLITICFEQGVDYRCKDARSPSPIQILLSANNPMAVETVLQEVRKLGEENLRELVTTVFKDPTEGTPRDLLTQYLSQLNQKKTKFNEVAQLDAAAKSLYFLHHVLVCQKNKALILNDVEAFKTAVQATQWLEAQDKSIVVKLIEATDNDTITTIVDDLKTRCGALQAIAYPKQGSPDQGSPKRGSSPTQNATAITPPQSPAKTEPAPKNTPAGRGKATSVPQTSPKAAPTPQPAAEHSAAPRNRDLNETAVVDPELLAALMGENGDGDVSTHAPQDDSAAIGEQEELKAQQAKEKEDAERAKQDQLKAQQAKDQEAAERAKQEELEAQQAKDQEAAERAKQEELKAQQAKGQEAAERAKPKGILAKRAPKPPVKASEPAEQPTQAPARTDTLAKNTAQGSIPPKKSPGATVDLDKTANPLDLTGLALHDGDNTRADLDFSLENALRSQGQKVETAVSVQQTGSQKQPPAEPPKSQAEEPKPPAPAAPAVKERDPNSLQSHLMEAAVALLSKSCKLTETDKNLWAIMFEDVATHEEKRARKLLGRLRAIKNSGVESNLPREIIYLLAGNPEAQVSWTEGRKLKSTEEISLPEKSVEITENREANGEASTLIIKSDRTQRRIQVTGLKVENGKITFTPRLTVKDLLQDPEFLKEFLAQTRGQRTLLHWAAISCSHPMLETVLTILNDFRQSNPNYTHLVPTLNSADGSGSTAVHEAAFMGSYSISFVQKSEPFKHPGKDGNDVFHRVHVSEARYNGDAAALTVALFKDNRADFKLRNLRHELPVQLAVRGNEVKMLAQLIPGSPSADIYQNNMQISLLHYAAALPEVQTETLSYIIKGDPDKTYSTAFNQRDGGNFDLLANFNPEEDQDVLHNFEWNSNKVRVLPCDPNIKDSQGYGPLHYAASAGKFSAQIVLLKAGASLVTRHNPSAEGDAPLSMTLTLVPAYDPWTHTLQIQMCSRSAGFKTIWTLMGNEGLTRRIGYNEWNSAEYQDYLKAQRNGKAPARTQKELTQPESASTQAMIPVDDKSPAASQPAPGVAGNAAEKPKLGQQALTEYVLAPIAVYLDHGVVVSRHDESLTTHVVMTRKLRSCQRVQEFTTPGNLSKLLGTHFFATNREKAYAQFYHRAADSDQKTLDEITPSLKEARDAFIELLKTSFASGGDPWVREGNRYKLDAEGERVPDTWNRSKCQLWNPRRNYAALVPLAEECIMTIENWEAEHDGTPMTKQDLLDLIDTTVAQYTKVYIHTTTFSESDLKGDSFFERLMTAKVMTLKVDEFAEEAVAPATSSETVAEALDSSNKGKQEQNAGVNRLQ